MTKLSERIDLPRYSRPWEYLNRAVCQVSDYQEPEVIRLRVPLLGVTGGPAIEKDVAIKYSARPAAAGDDRPWSLHWEPVGGGPYPEFAGELKIDIGEDRACALVIEGEYSPPLGAAGQAFDSLLGSRIASVTAREFLAAIAEQMHHEHVLQEAMDIQPH